MARTVSIYDADPDFRRDPKTDDWCWRCQKDLKPGQARRYVHIVAAGMELVHPDDSHLFEGTPGDCGCFPVGADCARKMRKLLGDDFTFEMQPLAPAASHDLPKFLSAYPDSFAA